MVKLVDRTDSGFPLRIYDMQGRFVLEANIHDFNSLTDAYVRISLARGSRKLDHETFEISMRTLRSYLTQAEIENINHPAIREQH